MVYYCCVPSCNNNGKDVHMHRFPVNLQQICDIWLRRIARENLQTLDKKDLYTNYRICEEHFHRSCILPTSSRRLKLGSLPIWNLGGTEYTVEDCIIVPRCKGSLKIKSVLETPCSSTALETPCSSTALETPCSSTALETIECTSPITECSNVEGSFCAAQESTVPVSEKNYNPSTSSVKNYISATAGSSRNEAPKTPKTSKAFRRRLSFLKLANVTRSSQLSPRASKLYRVARNLRRISTTWQKENLELQVKLEAATQLTMTREYLRTVVNEHTVNFILSQISQQKKKKKGRRYSQEEKLMALTLYKQSPKGYRLLQKLFALPTKTSLNKMLCLISIDCGLNNNILTSLKESVEKMQDEQKVSLLMFDEISLQPGLAYSKMMDKIIGFEDFGEGCRNEKFADRALVFMVKGVFANWKQPIAYYFIDDSLKGKGLAVKIKEVIVALQGIGLNVVATVCDQVGINSAAIKYLLETTDILCKRNNRENRYAGFLVRDHEVIPLFDPPHLLKGIRNNLLKRNAIFHWQKGRQTASWKHIIDFYQMDSTELDYKMCYKLTDVHVYASKMKKMKVSHAAQVLSQSVSSIMRRFSELGLNRFPSEAVGTADFLLFFDKLFDSFNGTSFTAQHGKYLRTALTKNSEHLEFWNQAVPVLSSIRFVENGKHYVPPSVSNWIKTIKNMKALLNRLSKEGYTYLKPRALNQDPLENFFGQIRSHGVRYVNPTCFSFIGSFKTLIINNFFSVHSPGSNCEADSNMPLNNLNNLLLNQSTVQNSEMETEESQKLSVPLATNYHVSYLGQSVIKYVGGFVLKKMLKFIVCKSCKAELLKGTDQFNFMINAKKYHPNALITPGSKMTSYFVYFITELNKYLEHKGTEISINHNMLAFLNQHAISVGCPVHSSKMKGLFYKFISFYHMQVWVKNINKTLKGLDELANKNKYNKIRLLAHSRYLKYKKRQAKMKTLKRLSS